MGGVGQFIFGGKKSKSSSSDLAYPGLQSQLGSTVDYTKQGGDAISALLGGDASGFDAYKKATGFDFQGEQGSRGITGNMAARGLLRSGATGKSLMKFGEGLQDSYAQNYINDLLGFGKLGLGSAGVLSDAGKVSSGKASDKPGIGGFLGQLAAG